MKAMSPHDIAAETLRELISQRVALILQDVPGASVSDEALRAVKIAALGYSARYLRSIFAERAARLLDDKIAELRLELDTLVIEEPPDRDREHTLVGIAVRRVPAARRSFPGEP